MKASEKVLHLQWVKTASATISSQIMISWFKHCGTLIETNGSEDVLIHCIKHGQMEASAAAEVTTEMAKLVTETNEHTMDIYGDQFLSNVEEDEAIIEDE